MPSVTAVRDDVDVRPAAAASGGSGEPCAHRMRVVGYVLAGESTRVDCDRPLRAVCRDCEAVSFWRCETYGCAHCGEAKKRRLARLIEDGSAQHLGRGLHAYFLTLTAPGVTDHLRWYQGRRPARREVCECHRHGLAMGAWNADESACWNRLRTSMTRDAAVQFVGAVETQKRGMLHRHIVLFSDRPLTHEEVQVQALAAGYGCVLDLERLDSFGKVSRYLTKYVAKGAADRVHVPWSRWVADRQTGELMLRKKPTYRLWSASHRWGVTMKQIKAAQGAQARQRAMYLRELHALLESDAGGQRQGSSTDASTEHSPP